MPLETIRRLALVWSLLLVSIPYVLDAAEIHHAAEVGDIATVKKLLATNPTAREDKSADGWTPLAIAARYGRRDAVELLLNSGANVDATNRVGWTALHAASYWCQATVAQLLIAKNARVGAKTIGHLVIAGGYPHTDWQVSQMTPLHLAAGRHCDDGIVSVLITARSNVNDRDELGNTPLHYAALGGDPHAIDLLLSKGADIESRNRQGATALHQTAVRNNLQTAKALLTKGVNVNAVDDRGRTTLHWAAEEGGANLVELLILGTADVNKTDRDGQSPLALARARNYAEAVEMLVKHGGR